MGGIALGNLAVLRNEAVWGLGGLGAEEVLFGDGRGGAEDGFEEGEGGLLFGGSRHFGV